MKKIFLLFSCVALWATIASGPYLCTAQVAHPDSLRVAFLADIHVTPGNTQDSLLRIAVDEINASACDLVVVGGDLCNMGTDAELTHVHAQLSRLNKPWHAVPGNHETTWSESACQTYLRLFGHDGRTAFRAKGYLFLGYASGPYLKMADGGIRNEDLAWIEREAREAKTGEKIISLCHYPLSNDLTNRRDITSLLNRYNVGVTLCGHYHRLALRNFDSIAGIQGRALVQTDKGYPDYGYTLLTFAGDSVRVCEKVFGEKPREVFTIGLHDDPQVLAIPCDPEPEQPDYMKHAELILQDAASVYTGAVFSGNIFIYGNTAGELIARDTRTNRELWRKELGGALYTTPLCTGKLVIAGLSSGALAAYDVRTGAERWRIETPTPVIGDGLIDCDALYIGLGDGCMAKIDLRKGRVLWRYEYGEGQAQGRPAIADGRLVFGAWDTHLYCLDAATGALHWKWNNGNSQRLLSPGHIVPRIAEGKVFIVAPDRYATALDLATGNELWRIKKHKVRETTGLSADGKRFYAKTMDGELLALDTTADDYHEAWLTDAGWGYDHNSCPAFVHDGVVYMANRSGRVAAIREDGKLLWQAKLCHSAANDFSTGPDGAIWVTFAEGKVFRIL